MQRITLPPGLHFPQKCYVAVSGGVDSIALLHFLNQGSRDITIVHFNHHAEPDQEIEDFVRKTANDLDLPLVVKQIQDEPMHGESLELVWARARHNFFSSLDAPVILAHHLDDVMETWMISSLKGEPHLIGWKTRNCFRPFLMTRKENLYAYCRKFDHAWLEDPLNHKSGPIRNEIRHRLMATVLEIQPGLPKILKKKLAKSWELLND